MANYKLIDRGSTPAARSSEMDLFSLPPTQVTVHNSFYEPLRLDNASTNEGPWQFTCPSAPVYTQLSDNFLQFELRIVKANGEAITNQTVGAEPVQLTPVGSIDCLGKTFFQQVKGYVNNQLVQDSGELYAYQALLETVLNYGESARRTHLATALYSGRDRGPDTEPGEIDHVNNVGWKERADKFTRSEWVQMYSRLHGSLFSSERLLPSQCSVHLELHRNSDLFCITHFRTSNAAATNFKIEVRNFIWWVRRVQLINSQHMAIERQLNLEPMLYPIRRARLTKQHINAGQRETPSVHISVGQLPRRVLFGFIASDAYYGVYGKSPFNFVNAQVEQVQIVAGDRLYPREPIECDFTTEHTVNKYSAPYHALLRMAGGGPTNPNSDTELTSMDFKHGKTLWAVNLAPVEEDGMHFELIRSGHVFIRVRFGADVPDGGLEMVVYSELDSVYRIDRFRNIRFDYAA